MLGASELPLRQGFRRWRKRLYGASAAPSVMGPRGSQAGGEGCLLRLVLLPPGAHAVQIVQLLGRSQRHPATPWGPPEVQLHTSG